MVISLVAALSMASWGCAHSKEGVPAHDSPYRTLESLQIGTILHVPTGLELSREQLFDLLTEKQIVYVGETHTNLEHHRIQLEVLKAMQARHEGRVALGMEMFDHESQPLLDDWISGGLDQESFLKKWYATWSMQYDYYRPILEFARVERIPIIALNATDEEIRSLARGTPGGLSDQTHRVLPELDPDDPYHRKAMEAVFGSHGPSRPAGKGREAFETFYRTMLLWDETMAETIARYLNSPGSRGRRLVILAGGFHVAYGFGIPRRVFRRLPVSYAIVLPQSDEVPEGREDLRMEVTPPEIPLYIADFVWKTDYRDLEGERVWLGVSIGMADGGVTVREIVPQSPAALAGLSVGDVIVALGEEPVREPSDLIYLVRQKKSGDRATVRFIRAGQPHEVEVKFQAMSHP